MGIADVVQFLLMLLDHCVSLVLSCVKFSLPFSPLFHIFFLSDFSFTDTDDSQDNRRSERTIFNSTLPFSLAHEHSDSYLQLCM